MAWICPECGNENKDELISCVCGYEDKKCEATGTDIYQKRVYMDRIVPTKSWETFLTIAIGFLIIAFGVAWCIEMPTTAEGTVDKLWGFFGLFYIFIGSIIIVDSVKSKKAMNEFEKATISTEATVLDRYTEEDFVVGYGGCSSSYYVVVRFDAVEKQYFIKAMVSKKLYEKAEQGNILSVTYANSNPCILLFEGEY